MDTGIITKKKKINGFSFLIFSTMTAVIFIYLIWAERRFNTSKSYRDSETKENVET